MYSFAWCARFRVLIRAIKVKIIRCHSRCRILFLLLSLSLLNPPSSVSFSLFCLFLSAATTRGWLVLGVLVLVSLCVGLCFSTKYKSVGVGVCVSIYLRHPLCLTSTHTKKMSIALSAQSLCLSLLFSCNPLSFYSCHQPFLFLFFYSVLFFYSLCLSDTHTLTRFKRLLVFFSFGLPFCRGYCCILHIHNSLSHSLSSDPARSCAFLAAIPTYISSREHIHTHTGTKSFFFII